MLSVLLLLVQACATAPQQLPVTKVAPVVKVEPQIQSPPKLAFKSTQTRDPKLPNEFFAMSSFGYSLSEKEIIVNTLILGVEEDYSKFVEGDVYQDWLKNTAEVWKTVPVEMLAPLGFKKGDVIQQFNFNSNTVDEYILKDQVHLLLIGSTEYNSGNDKAFYNRTFYLLLSDEIHSNYYPEPSYSDQISGIAYRGSVYKFQKNNLIEFGDSTLEENDKDVARIYELLKSRWDESNTELVVSEANARSVLGVTNYSLIMGEKYVHQDGQPISNIATHSIIKLPNQSLFWISTNDHSRDTSNVDGELTFYNILGNSNLLFIEEEESEPGSCYSLFVLKGDEIEQHYLKCRLRNCSG